MNVRSVLTTLGTLAAAAIITIGGYQLGWWLEEDAVNREAEINRNSYEVQETARDEVIRQAEGIAGIEVDIANPDLTDQQRTALEGQRDAMSKQLCNVASDMSGSITPMVDDIIIRHCK